MHESDGDRKSEQLIENIYFFESMLFCTDETDAQALIIHLYSNKQHAHPFHVTCSPQLNE